MDILKKLTEEFPIREDRAQNIIQLIDEGNTIPFIARYRKEMTGSCDDQVLREFNDRLTYLRNLEQRKAEVAKSITEQEKMTEEIQKALDAAVTLTEVEDIYRPYKQKKKTRASVAIERGLQPLADFILAQYPNADVKAEAEKYIDEDKGVPTTDAALQAQRYHCGNRFRRCERAQKGCAICLCATARSLPNSSIRIKKIPRPTKCMPITASLWRRSRVTAFSLSTAAKKRGF